MNLVWFQLKTRVCQLPTFQSLLAFDNNFWVDLIKKYMINNKVVCVSNNVVYFYAFQMLMARALACRYNRHDRFEYVVLYAAFSLVAKAVFFFASSYCQLNNKFCSDKSQSFFEWVAQ